ncbi:NADH/Ubiquinone/plastoquinone (complex I) [Alkalidesulfovibrio alkalitolerans DSM 16529]|uniref:NADH/Ubiquinone/plastoquinone (Complex I) n=1 Tax=Alkalidesulfovibrio alkalitolerans DSM 16529 TaxID=1121439 RepID=S7UST5_9BACT|nr:Na(+)/H(+) antiporter subunit D [Alkalidesulfovibrio alkalitolerans]EPR35348.1 NADH/Ubiquinone/plastoquinone (complex I) [Alkalidesulfovibrio alkalitolerans DSM 16529]
MTSSFYHPAVAFIALAAALPFFPGRFWKWLLPVPALLAIVAVFTMEPQAGQSMNWMGFTLNVGRVDHISLIFANVFAIQALLGFIYAFHVTDKRQHVFAALYVAGAFGCVFAGDYLTLFAFWELMSVASTMLILINAPANKRASRAGFSYFLVHTFGGLLMLAGILLRYKATGSMAFHPVVPEFMQYYDWLIMFGFGVNAAFIGLHAWLPDAYPEATIPGAVFMSAFTTKTAVYVLMRGFAGMEFLAWMGVAMALYGVIYATMENNARRILSYHIVSQVGYMVAGIGIGTAMTINGAAAHAYAHILYKGLLFMSVGAILFTTGTAKLNQLGGLAARMPWIMICYIVAGLSISGMPVFNGFVSKTMTIAGAFEDHQVMIGLLMEIAAVGTFLSVGIKLPYFAFFGGKPDDMTREIKPLPVNMYLAMFAGAILCTAQGLYPDMLYRFLPYPEIASEFHPWGVWQVLQALLLLGFTGLAFYLMRGLMKPHDQRNIDFELLYRLIGRAVLALVCRPLAWLDSVWTEVYRAVGLRYLLYKGRITSLFDVKAIDGVVDGTAFTTRAVGDRTAATQTGRLGDYLGLAAAIAFAALAVVLYAIR